MKKLISYLFASNILFAIPDVFAVCTYTPSAEGVTLEWTGYKTPKKVGVSGTFKKIDIKGATKAADMLTSLAGMTYEIHLNSISSGDEVRDTRIAKLLFLGTDTIKGEFLESKDKKLLFSSLVNKVKKTIILDPTIKGDSLTAVGSFDLMDFSLQENFAEFAKACFARHEGKSWSEVQVTLKIPFLKSCS